MANNILRYKGNLIGKSIKEENCEKEIENIFKNSNDYSCSIIYPKDVKIGKSMDDKSQIKDLTEISADDFILDIGPKTLKEIEDIIENSKTVLWNGPAGYFENPNFALGSYKIAKMIIKKIRIIQFFLLQEVEIQLQC